jgi:enoyl-[acyl-carrier-protein] reductase (NADH)
LTERESAMTTSAKDRELYDLKQHHDKPPPHAIVGVRGAALGLPSDISARRAAKTHHVDAGYHAIGMK